MRGLERRKWYAAVTVWSAWTGGLALAQVAPTDACIFEGTTRNSVTQSPAGKVSIRLIPSAGAVGYVGSSNAAGAFHFEGIQPGDYQWEAQRGGTSRWVLTDSAGHSISVLHLAPGQKISGSGLWFTPEGTVSGKVIGPDGEPLPDARITVIERKWRRGKRIYEALANGTADDAGEYHITGLEPGRYYLYAARPSSGPLALPIVEAPGKPETLIDGRYYPSSAGLDGAATVEVHGGDDIAGIDFRLPLARVFHVTGQGDALSAPQVRLKPRYQDQALDWAERRAVVSEEGKFSIDGVTPGEYFLSVYQASSFRSAESTRAAVTVTDQDSGGLVAPSLQRFNLKGRIRVEGGSGSDTAPIQIIYGRSDGDEFSAMLLRATPAADGSFTLADLTRDRYTLQIVNMDTGKDGGYFLKSVRVHGVAVEGREVDFGGGVPEDIELVLSDAVGAVEGTVHWPEQSGTAPPEPGGELTVVLVPENVASGDRRPITTYLDQDGRFRLTDLEPGRYRAFAVTNYAPGLWENGEFLRQMAGRGTAMEVAAKGHARTEVQVLRSAEVERVEGQIQ